MKDTSYPFVMLLFVAALFVSHPDNLCAMDRPTSSKIVQDSLLRHVVLFKFKADTPAGKISEIENAFAALQEKIPEIHSYEWGLNNSPEGLNKGFTHCFLLSFQSEEDRATYLPHPDHKAFGDLLGPYLEDVLVVDYWTP